MANPNKKLHINFNVLLDDDTDNQLIAIAKETRRKKADVVREAIRWWFAMKFQRKPICADGQDCRCPHAHIYPPADPTPDARPSDGAPQGFRP